MWQGAKTSAATSRGYDLSMIPLKINRTEGMTESATALARLLFLKQIAQIRQYSPTRKALTNRYMERAPSDQKPRYVPGILKTIRRKQPNRPICSNASTGLFLQLFTNPSLHLSAKITFGIRIIKMNSSP